MLTKLISIVCGSGRLRTVVEDLGPLEHIIHCVVFGTGSQRPTQALSQLGFTSFHHEGPAVPTQSSSANLGPLQGTLHDRIPEADFGLLRSAILPFRPSLEETYQYFQ